VSRLFIFESSSPHIFDRHLSPPTGFSVNPLSLPPSSTPTDPPGLINQSLPSSTDTMHPHYNLRFSSCNGSAVGRSGTPNGQGTSLPNGVTDHSVPSRSPTATQESEQPPPAAQTNLRAAGSIPSPASMDGEEVPIIPPSEECSNTFATGTFVSAKLF
jgi:hypothetical protein